MKQNLVQMMNNNLGEFERKINYSAFLSILLGKVGLQSQNSLDTQGSRHVPRMCISRGVYDTHPCHVLR